eukprot:TRINITY_DN3788_c0_g1_i2.p1 TRINITY_DN3788_c0_g1~~TRINITY_DN3788_c0_g1_i2.p1  ORF type:complete len:604 (+),score=22.74 TRINITY_DN3788_c0_g1_i2:450-2261(+)
MASIRPPPLPNDKRRLLLHGAFIIPFVFFVANPSHFSHPRIFRKTFRGQGTLYTSHQKTVSSPFLERKGNLFFSRQQVSLRIHPAGILADTDTVSCSGVKHHVDFASSCDYVKAHKECKSDGFIDYIGFFYCTCRDRPVVGYVVLSLWLVMLVYMLGNTAAEYFCPSLNLLAELLKLPPTVAGVTLLPFGNGAPDFFSNIAAFFGENTGGLGLSSVLGGGVFVTAVVVGSISLLVSGSGVAIDRDCFVRDLCFYLLTLLSLGIIIFIGRISLAGAIAFLSIYVFYAIAVAGKELFRKNRNTSVEETNSLNCALLDPEEPQRPGQELKLELTESEEVFVRCSCCRSLLHLLEWPLLLPRKLTIPKVGESQWSKGYTVASVALAPFLLAYILDSQGISLLGTRKTIYLVALLVSIVLSSIVILKTKAEHPPEKCLFPLVAGGFLMSVVWFYMLANEFVALVVALGTIFALSPSLIGLTLMAWGNSVGDLIANITLALSGHNGVQIALSGCYAGPLFNTVVALGTSLLLETCIEQDPFVLPLDESDFHTVGFLMGSLLWSLLVLPSNGMRPSKLLGIGLLILYFAFLLFRVIRYYVLDVSGSSGNS